MPRKNAQAKPASNQVVSTQVFSILREGALIVTVTFSLFLFLALLTYHRSDPGWSNSVTIAKIQNAGGQVGAYLSDLFLCLLGYWAFVLPVLLSYLAWFLYRHRHRAKGQLSFSLLTFAIKLSGLFLVVLSGTALASLFWSHRSSPLPFHAGGIVGSLLEGLFIAKFNSIGAGLLLLAGFLISITLFFGVSWFNLLESIGEKVMLLGSLIKQAWFACVDFWDRIARDKMKEVFVLLKAIRLPLPQARKNKVSVISEPAEPMVSSPQQLPQSTELSIALEAAEKMECSESKRKPRVPRYSKSKAMPRLDLLDTHKTSSNSVKQALRSQEVEQCILDFGIQVSVTAVHPGPVVTRYELQLAAGTKASKITALAKDLARSLSVISVRVVEVIPGKSVIGIELPNDRRESVSLQEVLSTKHYQNFRSALALALGKDIAGHPVVVDLAKMPHLLVAGTTGSGKSVCLNAMLLSLLYKSTPEQLRMILIDPKMLELSVYDDIPHLLTPVVTDMKDAANALRWCVAEMERRYRLMASLGVRNIAGYNEKVQKAIKRGAPLLDPLVVDDAPELQMLPQIVVIADEFADMMVVVGKKVETLIARLAQKARAAGVHLILATQRPSVDVITGLIKANIPTRIAFQVSSKVDSRTILDQQGAEQLLGQGDMLYLPPGTGVPVRVHGAFVSDEEVHRVVSYLKSQSQPDYIESLLDMSSVSDPSGYVSAASGENDGEQDALYDEAVAFIAKARRVSVSSVQRRFKIGYNRAARLVETMEVAGVVSKPEGHGSREVLIPPPSE